MNVQALKFDLCCAARLLFRFGLSVGNAGHLSITVGENRMLVNRFGPSFATMTPADVLTMDFNGNVLEHDPSIKPYVNETIHLHGVIHRYNPHIAAVAHTHPPNTVTWTTFRKLPQTFDQESCLLADDIAIVDEEFTGLAQSEDRVRPFAEALGKKPVVLLPNHGAITTGPSIQSALFRMMLAGRGMPAKYLGCLSSAGHRLCSTCHCARTRAHCEEGTSQDTDPGCPVGRSAEAPSPDGCRFIQDGERSANAGSQIRMSFRQSQGRLILV